MTRQRKICQGCQNFRELMQFNGMLWTCERNEKHPWWYEEDHVPLECTSVPPTCDRWLEYVVLGQKR